jgi:hypothetical protein
LTGALGASLAGFASSIGRGNAATEAISGVGCALLLGLLTVVDAGRALALSALD